MCNQVPGTIEIPNMHASRRLHTSSICTNLLLQRPLLVGPLTTLNNTLLGVPHNEVCWYSSTYFGSYLLQRCFSIFWWSSDCSLCRLNSTTFRSHPYGLWSSLPIHSESGGDRWLSANISKHVQMWLSAYK